MPGEERQPTGCHLVIRPKGNEVGSGTQNEVIVIFQDGEGADLDGKDRCEMA